jgi:hypothetical protein
MRENGHGRPSTPIDTAINHYRNTVEKMETKIVNGTITDDDKFNRNLDDLYRLFISSILIFSDLAVRVMEMSDQIDSG